MLLNEQYREVMVIIFRLIDTSIKRLQSICWMHTTFPAKTSDGCTNEYARGGHVPFNELCARIPLIDTCGCYTHTRIYLYV